MKYGVIVGARVSYRVEVEAESFNQAEDKALDCVKNTQSIEGVILDAARSLVPEGMLNDSSSTVEIICANG